MGILKQVKKENQRKPAADMAQVSRIIANANELMAKGILRIEVGVCAASYFPELLQDKDDKFIKAWHDNILTYWCIHNKHVDRYKHEMTFFNIDGNKAKLGTYTVKNGFKPVEVKK